MLRSTGVRWSRAALASSAIILPSDLAFTYPRFSPQTHLSDALPEIVQAKKLHYEAYAPGSNNDVIHQQLTRAIDIFRGVTENNPSAPPSVVKDWLGCGAALVRMDRLARTPARDKERLALYAPMVRAVKHVDLQKDLQLFDTLCVLVAAYADAAIRLATYGDGGIGSLSNIVGASSNLDYFKSPTDAVLTFPELATAVEKLLDAAYLSAVQKTPDSHSITSLRTAYMKLCALRGLLEIPCTGALNNAVEWLDKPARLKGSDEYLMAVLVAMRAELRARLENSCWGLEAVDEQVDHDFLLAGERIYFHFENCKPDSAITMTGMETLRDTYCSVALSKAAYYLSMAKDPAGDSPGVFGHHASRQFGLSPLMLCPSGGNPQGDSSSRVNVKSSRAKRVALTELERALKINRALFPHDKTNLKSGYILRLLACTYAELKDYMYANGLFNSAAKIFELHYGRQSLEVAELFRWQEGFHRFVGSTQEADTLNKQITAIREHHGLQPVKSLCSPSAAAAKPAVVFKAGSTKAHQ